MIECERCWTNLQKMQYKTAKDYWERITQKIYAPSDNLTMKQMFDISEKLIVGQSDEIYGVNPINWEDSLWKQLSFVSDEEVISLSHAKVFAYFQILCYALERWTRTQTQIVLGKKSWLGSRVHHNTEHWTHLMVSQWNSSGIFSQDSPHCRSPRVHL